MLDNALVARWYKLSSVGFKPSHCFEVAKALLSGQLTTGPPRLSLGSLAGPFGILLIGYLLATFSFISEKIVHYCMVNNNSRKGAIGGNNQTIVL